MPKRFISWTRTEPSRSILYVVALATGLIQGSTLLPGVGGTDFFPQVFNVLLVWAFCGWAIWASHRDSIKQMSLSAFWLAVVWMWAGLSRLAFSEDPIGLLLWTPFFVVAITLGIVYIDMSGKRRVIDGNNAKH